MSDVAVSAGVMVQAAMAASGPVQWDGALWIGAVDDAAMAAGTQVFPEITGYRTARLLVRSGRFPRGFVEVAIDNGRIDQDALTTALADLPTATVRRSADRPPLSVVLCTYDRPAQLQAALRSLLAVNYPVFEVVVVDNHPQSGLTRTAMLEIDDARVRMVSEPRAGLARARNAGTRAASHDIIAFTDDDVVIDADWLTGLTDGFAAGSDVACVCGIVPSGEIRSPSQAYFDRRVSWARSCVPEVFSLSRPRPREPLFPFQVGRYGTGANFALRRSRLIELGGFDEGLGVGSRCGGGEDIDLFSRVLLHGHELVYEPAALVWHSHRADIDSLTKQVVDYGTGLGAWLAKLALHPRTLAMMLRRALPGMIHLSRVTKLTAPVLGLPAEHDRLWRIERRAIFTGPIALLRARLAGDRSRPLSHRGRKGDPPARAGRSDRTRPGSALDRAAAPST